MRIMPSDSTLPRSEWEPYQFEQKELNVLFRVGKALLFFAACLLCLLIVAILLYWVITVLGWVVVAMGF
jgi:hypothetical protein